MKKRIIVNFDGVLHGNTSGWQGHDKAVDPPPPGAMAWLADMADRYEIAVQSARSTMDGGIGVMWDYLRRHLSEHFAAEIAAAWPDGTRHAIEAAAERRADALVKQIDFSTKNRGAHLRIDDRAWRFDGDNWPTAQDIERFKPWTEEKSAMSVKYSLKTLLDFIGHHESRGDYDAIWGGIRKEDWPPKPITRMTVAEVLAWQDRIDSRYPSEAAGKYQIMEDTLRGLRFPDKTPFDAETQDLAATTLMRRRGLDDYLDGKITAEKFANALAKEWASLPCVSGPKKGRSYYAGDGVNRALVDVEPFLAIVRSIGR